MKRREASVEEETTGKAIPDEAARAPHADETSAPPDRAEARERPRSGGLGQPITGLPAEPLGEATEA
jgi:hypothetical protein